MTTKGNLELKLGESTLYSSASADGFRVFEAIPRLVDFLDSTEEPKLEQFKDWFDKTSKDLIYEGNYHEGLTGGVPCEVIIDASRRIILHNAGDKSHFPEPNAWCSLSKFENACILLKEKYQYQIFKYTDRRVTEVMKELEN